VPQSLEPQVWHAKSNLVSCSGSDDFVVHLSAQKFGPFVYQSFANICNELERHYMAALLAEAHGPIRKRQSSGRDSMPASCKSKNSLASLMFDFL
jgi:hypothetical protein